MNKCNTNSALNLFVPFAAFGRGTRSLFVGVSGGVSGVSGWCEWCEPSVCRVLCVVVVCLSEEW